MINKNILQKKHNKIIAATYKQLHVTGSVTRLGDLLNFGQLFQAFGNN